MTYYVKSTTRKCNTLIVKHFREQKKGEKSEEISKLENEKILLVYLTLPKFEMKKRYVGTIRRIRKETEKFRRRLKGILMKKGCKEGGVSL